MTSREFVPGGYRYLPGVFQYSAGVAALAGFHIERIVFHEPAPLLDGFRRAEAIMRAAGRPPIAFCACELRSPAPFSELGFRSFNELYVGLLARWGLIVDGANPVARSNVPSTLPAERACALRLLLRRPSGISGADVIRDFRKRRGSRGRSQLS